MGNSIRTGEGHRGGVSGLGQKGRNFGDTVTI